MAQKDEDSLGYRAGQTAREGIGAAVGRVVTGGEDVARAVGTIAKPALDFTRGLFGGSNSPTAPAAVPKPPAAAQPQASPAPTSDDFTGEKFGRDFEAEVRAVNPMSLPERSKFKDEPAINTTQLRGVGRINPDGTANNGINFAGSGGAPAAGVSAAPQQEVRGWVVSPSGERYFDNTPVPTGGFVTELPAEGGITGMLAAGAKRRAAQKMAETGAINQGAMERLKLQEAGQTGRLQLQEAGQTSRAEGVQKGESERLNKRLEATTTEGEKNRAAVQPLHTAQAGLYEAQAKSAETAAYHAGLGVEILKKLSDPKFKSSVSKEEYDNLAAFYGRTYGRKPMDEAERAAYIKQGLDPDTKKPLQFATGGMVDGYAEGGAVGRGGKLHPLVAQYGQYLQATAKSGVPPIPFSQFTELSSAPVETSPSLGFAEGGAIPVAGKQVHGPGTGTSDSIPAVIDGVRPAGLSTGEFVIPEKVVRAKGTEFFEKLIAPYMEGA